MMAAMALTCRLSRLHAFALAHSHNPPPPNPIPSRFSFPFKTRFPASYPSPLPCLNFASKLSPLAASQTEPTDPPPEDSSKTPKRRKSSLMSPRLQEIATPLPEPPNYYLWAAGILLLYATRHAIATELIQWATIAAALVLTSIRFSCGLLGSLIQHAIQLVRAPLEIVLTQFALAGLFTRDMYSVIVSTTSVWPTLQALLLATTALSIGETTRSTAVTGQPWSFVIVTLLGVGAVFEVFHHTVFVFLLLLSVIYALLVQKKDAVSAFVPGTALLLAIAEPSLKAVAFASFLAMSIYTNWKNPEEQAELVDNRKSVVQPTIMVVAAVALGLTIAAQYLSVCQVLWLAK